MPAYNQNVPVGVIRCVNVKNVSEMIKLPVKLHANSPTNKTFN